MEERRFEANPQVGFLPVAVFLKQRDGREEEEGDRCDYKHMICSHPLIRQDKTKLSRKHQLGLLQLLEDCWKD